MLFFEFDPEASRLFLAADRIRRTNALPSTDHGLNPAQRVSFSVENTASSNPCALRLLAIEKGSDFGHGQLPFVKTIPI